MSASIILNFISFLFCEVHSSEMQLAERNYIKQIISISSGTPYYSGGCLRLSVLSIREGQKEKSPGQYFY